MIDRCIHEWVLPADKTELSKRNLLSYPNQKLGSGSIFFILKPWNSPPALWSIWATSPGTRSEAWIGCKHPEIVDLTSPLPGAKRPHLECRPPPPSVIPPWEECQDSCQKFPHLESDMRAKLYFQSRLSCPTAPWYMPDDNSQIIYTMKLIHLKPALNNKIFIFVWQQINKKSCTVYLTNEKKTFSFKLKREKTCNYCNNASFFSRNILFYSSRCNKNISSKRIFMMIPKTNWLLLLVQVNRLYYCIFK